MCLIICLSYKRHVNKGALNWRRKCSEKLEIDVYVVVDFCLLFFGFGLVGILKPGGNADTSGH